MAKTFVIADLHFSHSKIIEYENRPFANVEQMNKIIINNWNKVVSKCDTVFVLGDVSFTDKESTKELISRLNGRKVLILGNHDRGRSVNNFWRYVGFDEVYKYPIVYNNFLIMSHEPPEYFNSHTPYAYIYGHVHSTDMYRTITCNSACVSVERWDYTPVELTKLVELMKSSGENSNVE